MKDFLGYNVVFIKNGSRQVVRKNFTETQAKAWVEYANNYLKEHRKPSLDQFLSPNQTEMHYIYEKSETHVSGDDCLES